jgi:uncharacterized protein (DUF1778 family)
MKAPSLKAMKLRTTLERLEVIDRAARVQGKRRANFVLEASREKAEHVLLDQMVFCAAPRQYRAFLALMDAPLTSTAAVKRLLARRAPWQT